MDCGGMCFKCYAVDGLEFHEPFGENKYGWGVFQNRILLCPDCHSAEHSELLGVDRLVLPSMLTDDVDLEIYMEGGYDNWIKNHGLADRFAWLQCQKGD